jgi:hypothetical protein
MSHRGGGNERQHVLHLLRRNFGGVVGLLVIYLCGTKVTFSRCL